jgi:hypothetical protein
LSEDVAHELRRRCADQDLELPDSVEPFVERYEGAYGGVQLPLRLP